MTGLASGLSLGLGFGLVPGGSSVLSDIVVSLAGQSLHEHLTSRFSGAGRDEIVTAFELFGDTCTVVQGATGGTSILKTVNSSNHWVNDDAALADGPALTTWVNSLSTAQKARNNVIVFWAQTTADADALDDGTISKAEQKAGLEYIINRMRAVVPKLKAFVINLNHAHNVKPDAGWQLSEDIQLELIDEGKAERGVEFYDLPQSDGVHLTEVGYEEFGRRIGRRAAQIAGYSLTGAQGPFISDIEIQTDKIVCEVTQDAGTDIATPVEIANSREWFLDDGTLVEPIAVAKPWANVLEYTLPEGTAPVSGSVMEFFTTYGSLNLNSLTAKKFIKDNATPPLPLQSARLAVSNADPIQSLTGIEAYFDARGSAKTYSSAAIVDEITSLAGTGNFTERLAGGGPEFTTDYLRFKDTDDQLITHDIDLSTERTIFIAGKFPDTLPVSGFGCMLTFTNEPASGTTSFNGRLYYSATGTDILYQNSSTGPPVVIDSLFGGGSFCIALVFESASVLKFYRAQDISNGTISPHVTVDPADNPVTLGERVMLGQDNSGNMDALDMKVNAAAVIDGVPSISEIATCLTYLNDRHQLGLVLTAIPLTIP